MHEPIEDGVGDGRIIEPGVPVVDRQLAGDEGGFAGAAVVDDFEQIVSRRLIERSPASVVEDQHVDACELHEQATEACRRHARCGASRSGAARWQSTGMGIEFTQR